MAKLISGFPARTVLASQALVLQDPSVRVLEMMETLA